MHGDGKGPNRARHFHVIQGVDSGERSERPIQSLAGKDSSSKNEETEIAAIMETLDRLLINSPGSTESFRKRNMMGSGLIRYAFITSKYQNSSYKSSNNVGAMQNRKLRRK